MSAAPSIPWERRDARAIEYSSPRVSSSAIRVEPEGPHAARVIVDIDPEEPLFAGHYPGFPILPGVCLIEYIRRGALEAAGAPWSRSKLCAIASARFAQPVFPTDRVVATLRLEHSTDGWTCSARIESARGQVGSVRLQFALPQSSP